MVRQFGALALAGAMALVSPAAAQAIADDQLGARFAHDIFGGMNMRAVFEKQMAAQTAGLNAFAVRPGWPDLFRQAIIDELESDMPVIERIVGRSFNQGFTPDELRAGISLFEGDQSAELMADFKAASEGQKPAPPSPALNRALGKMSQTPAGRGFMQKLGKMGDMVTSAKSDMVAAVMPGVFIRFGEKARAAEAAAEPGRP